MSNAGRFAPHFFAAFARWCARKLGSGALRPLLLLGLAAATPAFAELAPTYVRTVCGQQVVYHPDVLKPCRPEATACTVARDGKIDIYFNTSDTAVLGHEEEHACGMRHQEPWVPMLERKLVCAIVTESGTSAWKKGDLMCRVESGAIVKMDDPAAYALALSKLTPAERSALEPPAAVMAAAKKPR